MSVERLIFDALKGLVATGAVTARVYPDIAPEQTPLPYITYQNVGGDSINFLNQSTPSKRCYRFQVNVWADTRQAASALSFQVEDALRLCDALDTTVLGAPISLYEPEVMLRGTRQDFQVWA